MNICIDDLTQKILSEASCSILFFEKLIDFITTLKPPYPYRDLGHLNNSKNIKFLNSKLSEFLEKHGIDQDSKTYFIFDNIRHAFIKYCSGGVLAIYKGREADVWYPKIIIRSNIGDRKDIEQLNSKVTIYRGASKYEYDSKEFGQSWTLDSDIAKKFAFEHYEGQVGYSDTVRVILKTTIDKANIYYYQKEDREKEVIINTNKLLFSTIDILNEAIL